MSDESRYRRERHNRPVTYERFEDFFRKLPVSEREPSRFRKTYTLKLAGSLIALGPHEAFVHLKDSFLNSHSSETSSAR